MAHIRMDDVYVMENKRWLHSNQIQIRIVPISEDFFESIEISLTFGSPCIALSSEDKNNIFDLVNWIVSAERWSCVLQKPTTSLSPVKKIKSKQTLTPQAISNYWMEKIFANTDFVYHET